MKDSKKQIEVKKLVNIITKIYPNKYSIEYPAKAIRLANELLERYQPKLPENSVVLTREELAKERELNRKIDREFVISEFTVQVNSAIEKAYKKGSKETAEKILSDIMFCIDINDCNKNEMLILNLCKMLAKQYSMEVEE